mmetsp:Transcript_18096/g.59039  ORF Transcript_18096/g.59039 Transcript_18096/m.59039 type:complete len:84 (-) Transcript_18096:116-367(-)
MSRVTRRLMVLKISVRKEGRKPSLKALEEEIGRHIQLHETVKHTPFWIDKFSRHGFYLRSRIRTPGHLCCAFVLQANDSLLSS